MIFISYNHQDADLIDTTARKLELEFGRKNIFYDSWSMQPGDGIIEKMDEGLEGASTFFFFISKNSLTSNMVKLEWQTALNKSVNGELKFIPVRLDDSHPPTILTDKMYIDLYSIGLEEAIIQMKAVIKKENTYNPREDIININARLLNHQTDKCELEIYATHFTEHNLGIVFLFELNQNMEEIDVNFVNRNVIMETNNSVTATFGNENFKGYLIRPMHPLSPNDSWLIKVSGIRNNSLQGIGKYYSNGKIELLNVTEI